MACEPQELYQRPEPEHGCTARRCLSAGRIIIATECYVPPVTPCHLVQGATCCPALAPCWPRWQAWLSGAVSTVGAMLGVTHYKKRFRAEQQQCSPGQKEA